MKYFTLYILLFQAVQQVISNLLVSHIELRSEDSADIKQYTHKRQLEKIVVKLGEELEFFKAKYLRVRIAGTQYYLNFYFSTL